MPICEHDIGFAIEKCNTRILTKKKLIKEIKIKIIHSQRCGNIDFGVTDYIPNKKFRSDFKFFKYCNKCGEKIDEERLRKSINDEISQFVHSLDNEKYKEIVKSIEEQSKEFHSKPENQIEPICGHGYIYIIKLQKYYKIGTSKKVNARIRGMDFMPMPIEIIYTEQVVFARKVEKELHEMFAKKHTHGEWFVLNEKDLEKATAYIKSRSVETQRQLSV